MTTMGQKQAVQVMDDVAARFSDDMVRWQERYEKLEKGEKKAMNGFNKVVLMGRLTRDPEVKQLSSGRSVCDLALAVGEVYKDKKTGEFVEKTCFVDLVAWGGLAESCGKYLKKGKPVLVEGSLQFDRWESQDGGKRSKHRVRARRVEFLSFGKKAQNGDNTPALEEEDDNQPF